MMSTLQRYVAREILLPFGVGLGLFFVVAVLAQVLKIADSVTGLGISGSDLWRALSYSLPPLLGLLLPVSGLFATLLGLGRLASDGELVALYAAGCSPWRLFVVPCCLGLLLSLGSALALAFGEPWGIRGLRDLMARSAQHTLANGLRPGEFNEWLPGLTVYAAQRNGQVLQQIIFADQRDSRQPLFVTARQGRLLAGTRSQDLLFEMQDGLLWLSEQASAAAVRQTRLLHFHKSLYRVDVSALVSNKARNLAAVQERSLRSLWTAIQLPGLSANDRGQLIITLQRKLAIPLAALLFALLAVPLAWRTRAAARARGFLLSTLIVAVYYYLGRAAELAARQGRFPALLAAWLPNLLGLGMLLLLLMPWRRRR